MPAPCSTRRRGDRGARRRGRTGGPAVAIGRNLPTFSRPHGRVPAVTDESEDPGLLFSPRHRPSVGPSSTRTRCCPKRPRRSQPPERTKRGKTEAHNCDKRGPGPSARTPAGGRGYLFCPALSDTRRSLRLDLSLPQSSRPSAAGRDHGDLAYELGFARHQRWATPML